MPGTKSDPPLTQADVGTQVAAALNSAGLGDIGTYTVASLPDPAATPRRTAWVSDLYGAGGRVVSEGGFWKPIRPLVTTAINTSV